MLSVAFSPCPNDTFTFHAWVSGLVARDLPVQTVLADVQELNHWALSGVYPVSKVSFHTLGHLLDDYVMLPVGAALGCGCGPKLIAREAFPLEALADKTMAVPGQGTTAHLLSQILAPEPYRKVFCLYDEVTKLIHRGEVDCGVIIHETRFTFEDAGFVEIADLGELWERNFSSQIPLGCLVGRRSLGEKALAAVSTAIGDSLDYAWAHPEASRAYVMEHSIETAPEVVDAHIALYVNQESRSLSEVGVRSIDCLLSEARKRGLLPLSHKPWLFELN